MCITLKLVLNISEYRCEMIVHVHARNMNVFIYLNHE